MLKAALRNLLAHKARQFMTVLAVCLGVAFVSGTLVFADSTAAAHRAAASKNFAGIAATVTPKAPAPGADAAQHGGGLDDTLARKLADVAGVASVRPNVDGAATMNAADGGPLRVRTGANIAAAYIPGADGKDSRYPIVEGRAPAGSGELAVDRTTAAAGHMSIGDKVTLATDGPVMTKRLVGIVTTTDTRVTVGGTLALFDKATAQKQFASPGHYTSIDIAAASGTDQSELARHITDVLPPDSAEAITGTAQATQQATYVDTVTRGFAKVPMVFAGVSLFIGSFLIVNTFTMLVARRSREIALLRAIGASRRQVSRSVLLEALLVGLVASAAGFLLGLAIASLLPGVLSTGGSTLPEGPLVIGPRSILAALAVGVGITMLAAWLPARRAAKVAPVKAMRTTEQQPATGGTRMRGLAGLTLLALGIGWLISLTGAEDASEENLQSAMLACALLAAALIVLAPLLAAPVIRLTGQLTGRLGITGRLATLNALRDPRRTAATATTLMISTALVAGLAVIGHSTSQAFDQQAADGLGADYVISTRTTMSGIDPAAVHRVADTAEVRTTSAVTDSTMVTGGQVREISGVDPDTVTDVMTLDFVSGSLKDLGPGRIAVSRTLADEHGLATGGELDLAMGQKHEAKQYTIVGVYQDNPTARDALGARSEVANNSYLPHTVQRILIRTDDHTASDTTEQKLRTAVGSNPLLKVQNRQQLVHEAAGTMADLLNIMYGMLAIGALISALGIVNTLAMSVAERTREIGALRALGMDRTHVRRMIRLEAVTVAAFGTLLGLAGGLFAAWAVGSLAGGAIAQYSLALPWGTLVLVCLVSLGIGAIAAAVPARRAAALSPLTAVAHT